MNYLVQAFGVFVALVGLTLVIRPTFLFDLICKYRGATATYVLAILMRIALGIALIIVAPTSHYPLILTMLGWILIFTALIFGVIGRNRFIKMLTWALSIPESLRRLAGIAALFFGGFLLYATR